MEFTFTSEVPPTRGRVTIDHNRANEAIDACIDNANEWAKVPYVYLYPDAEGIDTKKLTGRARNAAARRASSAASSPRSTSTTARPAPAAPTSTSVS